MYNSSLEKTLLKQGYITVEQLKKAHTEQKQTGESRLGTVLLKLGFLNETQLAQAVASSLCLKYVNLHTTDISYDALRIIPETFARKHNVLAFAKEDSFLYVACDNPTNVYMLEELKLKTRLEIIPHVATASAIKTFISKGYTGELFTGSVSEIVNDYLAPAILEAQIIETEQKLRESAPAVRLVETLLESAYHTNASDIHIEPFRDKIRIRMRIDGRLVSHMDLGNHAHQRLIARLKVLGGMNIAEHRIPQDGRFHTKVENVGLDVRVSTVPTVFGEKAVLRILSVQGESQRSISELGMTKQNLKLFKELLRKSHGMILVTGPTGSGKSTTLYAALQECNDPAVNIITVEDPVEKQLDGIIQIQVNPKAGLTFATALRSILRQDPDILMVGEIRDSETANIAARAAVTGHLVLSTLHTNDAASAVLRLVDMGVPQYKIAASLIGVVAQRLVRLLCPYCKEKHLVTKQTDLDFLGKEEPVWVYKANQSGCPECIQSGYYGRTAIHEVMPFYKMQDILTRSVCTEEIQSAAERHGMVTLETNLRELVLNGKTSLEEFWRIGYSIMKENKASDI